MYFISIAYTDHPVWRSHREEAKRGPPSGHRITRNGAAMVSLLLPYANTGLSRIAGRCLIGATPRGQPRTPVSCTVRRPFVGPPVPRQLMRNELFDLTTIVPATAYHRRSYAERYSRSKATGSPPLPRFQNRACAFPFTRLLSDAAPVMSTIPPTGLGDALSTLHTYLGQAGFMSYACLLVPLPSTPPLPRQPILDQRGHLNRNLRF